MKIKLNEVQKQMLKQMLEWDSDYSFGYYEFDNIFMSKGLVTRIGLQKNMAELRKLGLVKMYRGGINDDTGLVVGGTGFAIPYEMRTKVKELLDIKE